MIPVPFGTRRSGHVNTWDRQDNCLQVSPGRIPVQDHPSASGRRNHHQLLLPSATERTRLVTQSRPQRGSASPLCLTALLSSECDRREGFIGKALSQLDVLMVNVEVNTG